MRSLLLLTLVSSVAVAVGCRAPYAVHQPPSKYIGQFGQWEVLKCEVSPHIYNHYPGKEAEWQTNVDLAAQQIADHLRAVLMQHQPSGTPMRIQLKMTEYISARGNALLWSKPGTLTVDATFIDTSDESVVARCQATVHPERGYGGQQAYYSHVANNLARFVLDYAKGGR